MQIGSSTLSRRRRLRVCLINPTHTAIGSRIPSDHLPPLGLLAIGGPLLDDRFAVRLVDADRRGLDLRQTLVAVLSEPVDVVMMGHSGSSSAHRTVMHLALRLKRLHPRLVVVCGGVHPTYHWRETLAQCKAIDFIVRGEGERTARDLLRLLEAGDDWRRLPGIAWREARGPVATVKAAMLECLDDWRVGWELISHADYSYWGGLRAVVVQFSRGCPYLCSYCGQRGFWTRWRHRDPVRFAKELAAIRKGSSASEDREAIRLLRRHGILSMASCVVGFAERSDADFLRTLRHLVDYDPDQIQTLYATPHRWTPFFGEVAQRRVLEPDTRKWDYKHQVLETSGVPPWRVFAWVKFIEVAVQLRPKALMRTFFNRDPDQAHAMRWYTGIGRKVWFHEVFEFLFRRRHFHQPPTLQAFAGESMAGEEEAMALRPPRGIRATPPRSIAR